MRALARGILAGLLLSCLRAPLGIDLFQWPAVEATTAHGWRAAALAAVGLGLFLAGQASLPVHFLLGAALGFGVHGLLLAEAWTPATPVLLASTAGVGFALLSAVRPSRVEREVADASRPQFLEMAGIAAAAAGAAIAIEGVARQLRLLEGGLAQDDSLSASVLLAILCVGAAAFGWAAASGWMRGLSLPVGLAAAASACFVSLRAIARLCERRAFTEYLKKFGLDTSLHGMLAYDALLSAVFFVAPALVLGAALSGARGRLRILSVLVGSAVGLALVPGRLEIEAGSSASDAQAWSAQLIPLGTLIACAGAVVAVLSLAERKAIARWSGIAVSLALAIPAWIAKDAPLPELSPWTQRPVFPLLVSDTPEGLLTVESFGLAETSWQYVTLDRRPVTPLFENARADALRLRGSIELLPAERRARALRLLLVGQLTPERTLLLADCGVARIDRTAAWHASMRRIEDVLWSPYPSLVRPAGEILTTDEAHSRLQRGDYDLVIATAAAGDVPRVRAIRAPAGTTVVRWLEMDEPAEGRDLGDQVALTSDGFESPALAVCTNAASVAGDGEFAPLLLPAGEPRAGPTPLAWLRTRQSDRWNQRVDAARAKMAARLAEGARGSAFADLAAGLGIFYGSQTRSSQFETLEDRTELPDECLERFRSAVLSGPPPPFVRRLWDTLARTLSRKRWIEKIYAYVQPVAERHRPWPELEKALARADLESLEPEQALSRLDPLAQLTPDDFEVWYLRGEAQCAAKRGPDALESWKRAVWLRTSDLAARRKITMALLRSGDPEGVEAAKQLFLEDPSDHELEEMLKQPLPSGVAADPCAR